MDRTYAEMQRAISQAPSDPRETAIAAVEGAAIALRHTGTDEHAAIIAGLEAAAEMLREMDRPLPLRARDAETQP